MMIDEFPVAVALAVVSVGRGTGTTVTPEEPVMVLNVNEPVGVALTDAAFVEACASDEAASDSMLENADASELVTDASVAVAMTLSRSE